MSVYFIYLFIASELPEGGVSHVRGRIAAIPGGNASKDAGAPGLCPQIEMHPPEGIRSKGHSTEKLIDAEQELRVEWESISTYQSLAIHERENPDIKSFPIMTNN